jgi:uncharacterized membrane protein YkgB
MSQETFKPVIAALEMRFVGLMEQYGMTALRYAMGIVFIWFGILKPFGMSPAGQLVQDVTWWIPIPGFVYILGLWEVVIGICFIFKPLIRAAIVLLFLHMPGTALPFLLVPEQCWTAFPYALTLEGQYIVKNLVLVAAAMVIGGKIRHHTQGFNRFAPDEFMTLLHNGTWMTFQPGAELTRQGEPTDKLYFLHKGNAKVLVDGNEVAELEKNQFVGEMSFLTDEKASATVQATRDLECIVWSRADLERHIEEQPGLGPALMTTLSLDLIGKLKNNESSFLNRLRKNE